MSFRLKDDLEDSKSNLIFLDLSDILLFTKEELDKTLSRLPDLKLKPDLLEEASNKKPYFPHSKSNILNINKQSLKHWVSNSCLSKPSLSTQTETQTCSSIPDSKTLYINPLPQSMIHLNLNDFCGTEIDWKMLTLSRPSTKLEEDYFSKLVELYQFRHKTRIEDGYGFRKAVFRLSRHPRVMQYKPVSLMFDSFDLKRSENTKRILIKEDTTYEAYARVAIETGPNHYSDQTLAAELLSSANSLDFKLFSDQNL